jgi:hypothetical protein
MPYSVKKSSTGYPLVFFMTLSSDHITGATGLSPTVTISKSGGSFASPSGSVSEIANGWYQVAGNATDTGTAGPLLLHATAATADPTDTIFEVVAYDPQDATALGLSSVSGIKTQTDKLAFTVTNQVDCNPLTTTSIISAILGMTTETGVTFQQHCKHLEAMARGKCTGLDTGSAVYRDAADTLNRIAATCDTYGNRSAVTVNDG